MRKESGRVRLMVHSPVEVAEVYSCTSHDSTPPLIAASHEMGVRCAGVEPGDA